MFDMTESIAPKSDQLNAEDLLTGPRTFTVAEVKRGSAEQPVDVHLVEHPGRPFKPSKTVRRIMVAAWGPDASTYAGKRLTLYRDPAVRFGGQDVGGIRVSHMSHIDKKLTVSLTVTRGKRAPYVVQPLVEDRRPASPFPRLITPDQLSKMGAAFKDAGITDKDTGLAYVSQVVGRDVAATKELTAAEGDAVLAALSSSAAPALSEPTNADGWPKPAAIPGTE